MDSKSIGLCPQGSNPLGVVCQAPATNVHIRSYMWASLSVFFTRSTLSATHMILQHLDWAPLEAISTSISCYWREEQTSPVSRATLPDVLRCMAANADKSCSSGLRGLDSKWYGARETGRAGEYGPSMARRGGSDMPQGGGDESADGCGSDGGATGTQPKQPREETGRNMGAAGARPAPQNGARGDTKSQSGGLGIDAGGPHGATKAGAPNSGGCECKDHISRARHCAPPHKLRRQP